MNHLERNKKVVSFAVTAEIPENKFTRCVKSIIGESMRHQEEGCASKDFANKPGNTSSVSRTHVMEGKNQFVQVFL